MREFRGLQVYNPPLFYPTPSERERDTHTKLKVVINKNLARRLIHNLDIPFPFFYWGAGAPETPSPTYTGVDFNDIPSPLVNPGSTHDILVYFFVILKMSENSNLEVFQI